MQTSSRSSRGLSFLQELLELINVWVSAYHLQVMPKLSGNEDKKNKEVKQKKTSDVILLSLQDLKRNNVSFTRLWLQEVGLNRASDKQALDMVILHRIKKVNLCQQTNIPNMES